MMSGEEERRGGEEMGGGGSGGDGTGREERREMGRVVFYALYFVYDGLRYGEKERATKRMKGGD